MEKMATMMLGMQFCAILHKNMIKTGKSSFTIEEVMVLSMKSSEELATDISDYIIDKKANDAVKDLLDEEKE